MIERIEINLLPAEYRMRKQGIALQRESIYSFLGLGVLAFALWTWTMSIDAQIGHDKAEIKNLNAEIQANRNVLEEINRLKSEKSVIEQKIRALELINVNREKWIRFMELFCERLPGATWLTSIQEKENELVVQGKTYSFQEVANFYSNLSACGYITSIDLSEINQTQEPDNPYKFSLTCKINPDAMLPVSTDSGAVQPTVIP